MSLPAQPFAAGVRPDAPQRVARLKVAFVINRIGVVDMLSLPLVAAIARERGHRVALVEYAPNPRKARAELEALAPDIVAYSVTSNERDDYLAINRALKKALPFFAVFGGPLPTYSPELIRQDSVDAMCRGESDRAFPQFLETFGTDAMYDVPNFSFQMPDAGVRENPLTDLIADLDSLPFPARDLVYAKSRFLALNPIKAFMAGRGCPYECAHCFNSAYRRLYRGKGRMLRTKGVSRLIAEIQDVRSKYPLTFVRFHDDVFGADRAWLAEFAERFPKEVGLPFSCYVRPNMVSDEHAQLLKKARCHAAYTAIECGNEHLRNQVLRRHLTNEQIITAADRLKKAGLRIFSFNMIGVPGETEDDIFETIALNERIGVDFSDVSIFQPFPGTEAYDYCKEHGFLDEDAPEFSDIYRASVLNIDPALKQRIYVLHKLFTLMVDHPSSRRLRRFLPKSARFNGLLNVFYRFYYGYFLHRRIYASQIPLTVQLRGAAIVLFSRDRI